MIARVTDAAPSPPPMGSLPAVDFVPVSVVSGPIPADASEDCSVVYDTAMVFASRFPAIALPATYVIDPDGRLVAILDDHGWPGFLEDLIRQSERAPAHGAIEVRDISR